MNNLNIPVKLKRQELTFPRLPLAVYREISAHLRQVNGVSTGLTPQKSKEFDYLQSQVGGLWIEYEEFNLSADNQAKINSILSYYADKYGNFSLITAD